MTTLALDIGETVGWARSGGRCGAQSFAYADHGWALAMFSDWIEGMLSETTRLAVERPFGSSRFQHRLTMLMEGVAHMHAAARNIPRTDRTANEVRFWLLGFTNISPKDEPVKAQRTRDMDKLILAAVRARGFDPEGPHAADGAALLCCVEGVRPREMAA